MKSLLLTFLIAPLLIGCLVFRGFYGLETCLHHRFRVADRRLCTGAFYT